MGWLDSWIADLAPAQSAAAPLPIAKPAAPRQPKPEIKEVWVETRAPRDGDCGEVEAGFYSVADGVVTMRDEKGVPTGKTFQLAPQDDARAVAGRLTSEAIRKARGTTDFNRPLGYARHGIA